MDFKLSVQSTPLSRIILEKLTRLESADPIKSCLYAHNCNKNQSTNYFKIQPSRLESQLNNDHAQQKMSWLAYIDKDKIACLADIDDFLQNLTVNLGQSYEYLKYIDSGGENLREILSVNYENKNFDLPTLKLPKMIGTPDDSSLFSIGKLVVQAFCPLPDLDPTKQNCLLLESWSAMQEEFEKVVKVFSTFWDLNFCCDQSQYLQTHSTTWENSSRLINTIKKSKKNIEEIRLLKSKLPAATPQQAWQSGWQPIRSKLAIVL